MKNEFSGKTIILGVPNHFGLPEKFKENLEFLGFDVFLLKLDDQKIKLTLPQKILHFAKKTFTNDTTYRARLSIKAKENNYLQFINKFPKTDFTLIIRPDLLGENLIKIIKQKSNYLVAYQWDGINRFPLVKELISLFDKFLVFDEGDVKSFPETKHTTNFYFDDVELPEKIEQDVFFVGTFMKDRIDLLGKIAEKATNLGLKNKILLITKKEKYRKKYQHFPILFTEKGINFNESIKEILSSKILLDFKNNFHYGLSFRTFEALGYAKKLITNNALVKNYDFYHPHNIFVIENENIDQLEEFLQKKSAEIPKNIVEKYSFTHWIKTAFNL